MHDCKYCQKNFATRRAYEEHLPCPQRRRSYKPDETPAVGTPDFSAGITNDNAPDFSNVDSGSDFSGGGGESAGGGASGDF